MVDISVAIIFILLSQIKMNYFVDNIELSNVNISSDSKGLKNVILNNCTTWT